METTGYPCPACGAPADLGVGCSGCGRPPHPPAAEVIRLDREIVLLGDEVERARRTYQGLADRLAETVRRRAELAAAIRAEFPGPAARPATTRSAALPGVPSASPAGTGVAGGAETSTRTVQGLLFVLGGLLLGTAAVVFTAVAWATVGVVGRALILAGFTALTLAVPLLAVRRGLRGTAETFAAVGLLLVLLDGYAAWTVDLAGVAGWPGTRYTALVGGAGAAVAAGYALLSRLTLPWFAALLTMQPVLPLLAAEFRPAAAGWAVVFVGVAVLDLAVVAALRRRGVAGNVAVPAGTEPTGSATSGTGPVDGGPAGPAGGAVAGAAAPREPAVLAGRILAWIGHATALGIAACCALVPLALGRAAGTPLLAGAPLLLVAATLLLTAQLVGGALFRQVAAGLLVPVLAAALLRPVAELRGSLLLLLSALVAVALAGAVRLLPPRWRAGPRIGGLVVAGALGVLTVLVTATLAGAAVSRSLPPWRGAAVGPHFAWGWQLPVATALTVAALALLLPRATGPVLAAAGAAATVLAVPAGWAAPWPAVVVVDLAAGVGLLAIAVARPWHRVRSTATPALAGATLLGHGLLVGFAAPGGAGAALAVTVAAGLGVAAAGRRGTATQRRVAGCSLAAALLAVPAGAALAAYVGGAPAWWQSRAALTAAALLPAGLLAVGRHWTDLRRYASTALAVAAVPVGLAPVVVPAEEPVVLYAAVAVLLTVLGIVAAGPDPGLGSVGIVLLVVAVTAAAPMVLAGLIAPYGGVPVWSGVPPAEPDPTAVPPGLALLALAVAAALAAGAGKAAVRRRAADGAAGAGTAAVGWRAAVAAAPFLAPAVPVLLVAAGAPWPVVPAVTLLIGVAAVLVAALAPPRPLLAPVAVPLGLVLTGSGVLGLLATRAGTLAGLGALVVAASIVGAAGRSAEARIAGRLAAVAAATTFAVTAPLAGGLPLRTAAFTVLAVAVLTIAVAARFSAREAGPALDAAAQAVALVALLLAAGSLRHAAAVCVLWGVAVGLRLLHSGEPVQRRWAFAGVAGGSELLGTWLLLAAGGVAVLEAYTVPAAALALGAGLVALRTRAGLTSWLALGPGLAAGLLPSLASVLAAPDPQPWRRLLVGAAALGAVLAGAARRWQAPVVLGGATLLLLALHELARSWDLLPRWAFLAAGGLALIGLAATYERRRRDLARLRAAVGRMG